jgi:hypothetical protein
MLEQVKYGSSYPVSVTVMGDDKYAYQYEPETKDRQLGHMWRWT